MWLILEKATDLWDAKSGTQTTAGDSTNSCENRCLGMKEACVLLDQSILRNDDRRPGKQT
jgi:hypothetical protein